ncbi:MAG: hypothetical protein A2X78_03815 [Gammaproteobacteria bacterium GWE2_37_16]|nr:MAG: hypothetical protein A2X78_03815 [Gammaproteobacteria bacterium GWE2_37_16]
METNWHHDFNPQKFLSKIDVDKLLVRNEVYAEKQVEKIDKACISCASYNAPGILLVLPQNHIKPSKIAPIVDRQEERKS